jgi:hypothetical protein
MITRNSGAGFYRKYRKTCAITYAPSTYSAKKHPKIPARAPNHHEERLELLPYLVPSLLTCLFRRRNTAVQEQAGSRPA